MVSAEGHTGLTTLVLVGMRYRIQILARANAIPLSDHGCQLATLNAPKEVLVVFRNESA